MAMRLFVCAASTMQASKGDRLKRAKEYPYKRPPSSFLFVNGKPYTFPDSSWTSIENIRELVVDGDDVSHQRAGDLFHSLGITDECAPRTQEKWTPVLAIASNAGPEQLERKLPPNLFPRGAVVPVVRGVLPDFDVAYSPLISSYGSCTATLAYSPGSTCEVFVSFFTANVSKRMDETEGGYYVSELKDIALQLGLSLDEWRKSGKGVQQLSSIIQYNEKHGILHMPNKNGTATPIALKAVPAHDRAFPALYEDEMLSLLHETLSKTKDNNGSTDTSLAGDDLDSWILKNIDDQKIRLELVDKLVELAKPFPYEQCTTLRLLDNKTHA